MALIEMERAGGTCLNHGCKPTKALRASASVAHQARRAAEYGVNVGEVTVDFGVAISRVRSIISGLQKSLDDWLESIDGLDLIHGTATLATDPEGKSHRVTGRRSGVERPGGLSQCGRPRLEAADSRAGHRRRDDRGRAARAE